MKRGALSPSLRFHWPLTIGHSVFTRHSLLATTHTPRAAPLAPRRQPRIGNVVRPGAIVKRFWEETDVSIRRALLLSLGEFDATQFPVAERRPLIDKLLAHYQNDPDPGLHGAAEWLLRQWGQAAKIDAIDRKIRSDDRQLLAALRSRLTEEQKRKLAILSREVDGKGLTSQLAVAQESLQNLQRDWLRGWYVNGQGQTFVILNADKPFRMGSPAGEPDRVNDAVPHQRRIGRMFAIASKVVTKAQFRQFQQANPDVAKYDIEQSSRTDDSPQVGVDWYEAARYCNWLSDKEGIPKEQWCYEPNDQGKYAEGMKPAADYLRRCGYRLPTEAEWEYACRSGSQTSRYYGLSVKLLPKYAWFFDNSDHRAWPVGMKKPNDNGLFDMHGNAWQWCDNVYANYAVGSDGSVSEDQGSASKVGDKVGRVLRGGSFLDQASIVRSAYRALSVPSFRHLSLGFRVARTCP